MSERRRGVYGPLVLLAVFLAAGSVPAVAQQAAGEQALGERFDVRAFHDAVLANGALPLPVLEREIETFIAGSMDGR